MRKKDYYVLCAVLLFFAPFFLSDAVYQGYKSFNAQSPLLMAFGKFAFLATFGEVLGLRIKSGNYNAPGFGILPRAIVWGVLGVWIAMALCMYKLGVPAYLATFPRFAELPSAMAGGFSGMKLLGAFLISLALNTSFAPVFMVLHKITDTHIAQCQGKMRFLLTPINFGEILAQLNWRVQWGFVFKKTIPLFWIPAHTITFILPCDWQVLFAALLGIALGLILSIASLKSRSGPVLSGQPGMIGG